MKITFQEVVGRKEWIHRELLHSLTGDIINKAIDDQYYDVKLLVNGIELEPVLFNNIMDHVEKFIDSEAKNLVNEKLEIADNKSRRLQELINDAIYKIREEFDLLPDNDD